MGRAIVRNPKVFLFDEPLSNLDAKLRGQMRVEIKNLQRSLGVTSVYVTHDQLEAMTLADILVVMNAGRVEQAGDPLDIYEKPASIFVASFIGAPPMNLLPTGEGGATAAGAPAGAATIGFRPEDAEILGGGEAPAGALLLQTEVEAIEPVGAESFLYCAAAGSRIVVRVPGRAVAKPGDKLEVATRADKLHFFDGEGRRVA
ncbi:TOBE domain-containing protein [Mesorhizobium marinum]|uniref:TOBE domain-containing protein n=1 Tax=Mesorhizobium marinum TaxID=3228790 RepID=UPI003F5CB77C